MIRKAFFFLTFLLPVALVSAQDSRATQIDDSGAAYLAQGKAPGFSVAICEKGEIVYARGFGSADLNVNAPAKPETLYRLASVSKPLTALAVMRLVEMGKVDLEADIHTYVPSFPDKGARITVREILCHQSGIRHYVAGRNDGGKHYANCTDALEVFAKDPLLFEPGTRYSYSTHAFTLLGALIENVTGKSYEDELHELVTGPAGLTTPRAEHREKHDNARSALYGLTADGAFQKLTPDDLSWKLPGGGTEATAVDLSQLGWAILEGKVVTQQTLTAMWSRQKTNDGKLTGYGLGWAIAADHVDHSGSQRGAESMWMIYPDRETVIVVLSNLQGNPIEKFAGDVARIWLTPR